MWSRNKQQSTVPTAASGVGGFATSAAPPGPGAAFSPPPSPPPGILEKPAGPPPRGGLDRRQWWLLGAGALLIVLVIAGAFFAFGFFAGGGGGGQTARLQSGPAAQGLGGQAGAQEQAGSGPLGQARQMLASGEASLVRGTVVSRGDGVLKVNTAQGEQQLAVTGTTRIMQRGAGASGQGGQAQAQLAAGERVLVLARNVTSGDREAIVVVAGQAPAGGAGN